MVLTAILLVWLIFDFTKFLSLFNPILFLLSLSFSIFILNKYLISVKGNHYWMLKVFTSLTIFLPLIFIGLQFFNDSIYKKYWPLLTSLIVLQSTIGIMSIHKSVKNKLNISSMLSLISGILTIVWVIVVSQLELSSYGISVIFWLLCCLSIFVLVILLQNIFIKIRSKNQSH